MKFIHFFLSFLLATAVSGIYVHEMKELFYDGLSILEEIESIHEDPDGHYRVYKKESVFMDICNEIAKGIPLDLSRRVGDFEDLLRNSRFFKDLDEHMKNDKKSQAWLEFGILLDEIAAEIKALEEEEQHRGLPNVDTI